VSIGIAARPPGTVPHTDRVRRVTVLRAACG